MGVDLDTLVEASNLFTPADIEFAARKGSQRALETAVYGDGHQRETRGPTTADYAAALDEVLRAKPSAAKGKYVKKITVATTMGPGIPVDPNKTRGFFDEEGAATA